MEGSNHSGYPIGWRVGATVAFVAMLTVNAMANLIPINNLTTGEVADLYPNLFTPAGITFSIWSVIYLQLAGFIFLMWEDRSLAMTNLAQRFILTCVLNATWVLVWHNLLPAVSVVIMIGLLITLGRIFLYIHSTFEKKGFQLYLIFIPFSIYFAWISVATIANISAWLTAQEWTSLESVAKLLTIVLMAVAALISITVFAKYRRPEFPLVVTWALVGIYIRWRGDVTDISVASIVTAAATVAIMVFILIRKKSRAV